MQRQTGSTFLPLRVNSAGMIPLIFAFSIIILPATIASYFRNPLSDDLFARMARGFANTFDPMNFPYWIAVFVLVVWRRNQWRREARTELRRIQANSNSLQLWPALLSLALESSRLSGHRHPLPELAFQAPDTVTDDDVAALIAHVKKAIRP